MENKQVTFREMRDAINAMPPELLDKSMISWFVDQEGGSKVVELMILEEDYCYDGDEGCLPESVMKESCEDFEENIDKYHVVHPKGTIIIVTDNL